MSTFSKITKYLLLIAVLFSLVTLGHLVFVYCYYDSAVVPETGGTVGVGLVGDPATLDPLKFGQDENADVILGYLFRSMLRYDETERQVVGDVGNCDLGANFALVKCYLKEGGFWSDGSPITKEDALATYDALKTSTKNPALKRILDQMTIADKGDHVEFTTADPDLEILTVLTYPIVKKSMVQQLLGDGFDLNSYVSSGPYTYAGMTSDEAAATTTITLARNERQTGESPVYIGRYAFRFFPDAATLMKNEDLLNVILGPDGTPPPDSPRFERLEVLLPQYVSLFMNSERVPKSIRNLALVRLDASKYPSLDPTKGHLLGDVFFGTGSTPVAALAKNPADAFAALGYYRRDALIDLYRKDLETLSGQIAKASAPATEPVRANPVKYNTYFDAPTRENMYFSSGSRAEGITIGGKVPADVTAVFINGYRLSRYVQGAGSFTYVASAAFGNLSAGTNVYRLVFEREGKRQDMETLTIYSADDAASLETLRSNIIGARKTPVTPQTTLTEMKNRAQSLEKSIATAESLDTAYYYNRDLARYSLDLVYTNQARFTPGLVGDIVANLKEAGIAVNAKEISLNDVKTYIETGAKTYDMILTGIHLGMSGYDVFPFFHSGQAQIGFNFSKIKNIPLDVQLEALKFRIQDPDKLDAARKNILGILRTADIVKPFYSAYQSWYVDRNVTGIEEAEIVPSSASLKDLMRSASVSKRHEVDWATKTLPGFFVWLYHGMFP